MSRPLVSVITPAHQCEDVIGQTIESVLNQTMADLELLVVDDASRDGTRRVVESYALKDPRVRLLVHSENRGPAAARNTAIQSAGGRYLAFLDGDDCWLPEKLERHLTFVRKNQVALSYTQYRRIDKNSRLISPVIDVPPSLDYSGLLKNTAITTSTVMLDLEKTGAIAMRDVYYDDYVCWLEVLRRGHIAFGLKEDLTRYRVLGGSWSRNKLRSARHVWHIYRAVERLPLWTAAFVFSNYALNAVRKYRK